jgi:LysM repeat protein
VAVVAAAACGQVPNTWLAYTVQAGDTLFQLSLSSGATISEIVQANCLERNLLYAGTTIFLPAVSPTREACGPPLNWVRYVVLSGDTLFSLARAYNITVYAIMQANCLVSSRIFVGRSIYLPPEAGMPTATAAIPPTEVPTQEPPPPPPPPPPTASPTPAPPSATPTDQPTPPPPATSTNTPLPPSPTTPPTETPPEPTAPSP